MRELGADTPWHVSRFFPAYRMSGPGPTPVETLERARELGFSEGLKHVYTGNVRSGDGENTFCPSCGKTLIRRHGYVIVENHVPADGRCPDCGAVTAGRFG